MRIVEQDVAVDVEEELKRVLVQEVHLVQAFEREVNGTARLRQRHVLLADGINFGDHLVAVKTKAAKERTQKMQVKIKTILRSAAPIDLGYDR